MDPKPTRDYEGPEAKIQRALIKYLEDRGWFVTVMHGNMYQSGIPDLYAVKAIGNTGDNTRVRGIERWIEVKHLKSFEFTRAQLFRFNEWTSRGVGIYILVDATDSEYKKLFGNPNWTNYLIHPNRKK